MQDMHDMEDMQDMPEMADPPDVQEYGEDDSLQSVESEQIDSIYSEGTKQYFSRVFCLSCNPRQFYKTTKLNKCLKIYNIHQQITQFVLENLSTIKSIKMGIDLCYDIIFC